jgi:hypothetical protein
MSSKSQSLYGHVGACAEAARSLKQAHFDAWHASGSKLDDIDAAHWRRVELALEEVKLLIATPGSEGPGRGVR